MVLGILALVADTHRAGGGISQYNRDLFLVVGLKFSVTFPA